MTKNEALAVLLGRLESAGLTAPGADIDDREYTPDELDGMIAACYVRVSTDDQTELSPESQVVELQKAVRLHNRILPTEYMFIERDGVSGRKARGRDAFNEMISTAKNPPLKFSTLYLWKFSRFARNQEESIVYKSLLRRQCGVEVVSVSEPLPEGPFGSLIERIIEWMDEYYSIRLSGEVKRSMSVKARRGELQATPSFGYRVENNILVPVPEEAAYVREIYRRFLSGDGYFTIAAWLNSCGVTTHRGGHWENRTVEFLIRNPVYVGKLRWTTSGKRSRHDYNNPDTIIADARHEPLVDAETWDAAQALVEKIKQSHRPYQRPENVHHDWMSGLVHCSVCGASLTLNVIHHSWRCGGYARGKCKTSQNVQDKMIKALLCEALEHDAAGSHSLTSIRTDAPPSDRPDIHERIAALHRRLNRLREAYLAGVEELSTYAPTKRAIENDLAALEAALDSEPARERTRKKERDDDIRKHIRKALTVLRDPSASDEEKHRVAHDLIYEAVWDRPAGTLTVAYK